MLRYATQGISRGVGRGCWYSTAATNTAQQQPAQPRSAVLTTQERGNPLEKLPEQAENRATKWSPRQRSKQDAFVGPRFEQKNLELQPNPKAAIELIAEWVRVIGWYSVLTWRVREPVRLVEGRVASCDGGKWIAHKQRERSICSRRWTTWTPKDIHQAR